MCVYTHVHICIGQLAESCLACAFVFICTSVHEFMYVCGVCDQNPTRTMVDFDFSDCDDCDS